MTEAYKRVKEDNAKLRAKVERLTAALRQALRQWHMYAESVEHSDERFDLAQEKSPEGDLYRQGLAALGDEQSPGETK